MGSSPLTRGKLPKTTAGQLTKGLIPAHAGKTLTRKLPPGRFRAHPRSRGENQVAARLRIGRVGSSPLTRGKRQRRRCARLRGGLIPAHAGKTRVAVARARASWAHPRSRGENDEKWAASDAMQGSSPLTRGKPSGSKIHIAGIGLIPAHAGKTPPWADSPSPRSGSSPLTRGKPGVPGDSGQGHGLIPAHAGKTFALVLPTCQARAHPRSRGENSRLGIEPNHHAGSSPLTRGKLLPLFYPPVKQGLIPAHAGKTVRSGTRRHRTAAHPRSRGENRSLRTFAV